MRCSGLDGDRRYAGGMLGLACGVVEAIVGACRGGGERGQEEEGGLTLEVTTYGGCKCAGGGVRWRLSPSLTEGREERTRGRDEERRRRRWRVKINVRFWCPVGEEGEDEYKEESWLGPFGPKEKENKREKGN